MKRFLFISVLFSITLYANSIFILKSNHTIKSYIALNLKPNSYHSLIELLSKNLEYIGYRAKVIGENEISSLKKGDTLFLADTLSLDKSTITAVINFVQNGGNLIFNFNCAFNYKDYLISQITNLKWYPNVTHIDLKGDFYATPKILSPLTKDLIPTKRVKFIVKERLPIFKPASYLEPVLIATTIKQNQTLIAHKNKEISINDSGILWHGEKDKGRWVYFNFSISSLLSLELRDRLGLLRGIVNYLQKDFEVIKFPFLNRQNAVFISENGEYKFEEVKNFAKLSDRYDLNLTLFFVANDAMQNQDIINQLKNKQNIEFGSFGYTNQAIAGGENEYMKREIIGSKNLIDSFSEQKRVFGFRPPRYNVTSKMIKYITQAGYTYVIDINKDRIYPFFETPPLLTIPKTATDDYEYMILLEWSDTLILEKMKKEADLILYLNGVFTFNIHSHIMGDFRNIDILEDLIDYLKRDGINFMSGKEIYYSVKRVENIKLQVDKKSNNYYYISIDNQNRQVVEEFKFRLYLKPKEEIKALYCQNLNVSFKKRKGLNEYDIIANELQPNKKYKISIEY